jgi:hypothetical protein
MSQTEVRDELTYTSNKGYRACVSECDRGNVGLQIEQLGLSPVLVGANTLKVRVRSMSGVRRPERESSCGNKRSGKSPGEKSRRGRRSSVLFRRDAGSCEGGSGRAR